ncbi:MAG TPA: tRNA preQ1(34) S-adenosylmethionine ribosyltransferase-isomerase QueA [Aestuariivirgaceae bacterium]|nr:tRNA preQ1(34) S-adenosylmethionine ribosyltransferase-isomerase QueA [Aestuariivirgaceae bacterium]
MRVDAFDFELPEDRIALRPVSPRDHARLLIVRPPDRFEDRIVRELPAFLLPGDMLVLNDTRVITAAFHGRRIGRGDFEPEISALIFERIDASRWKALAKPGKRLKLGDRISFGARQGQGVCLLANLDATVEAKGEEGEIILAFDFAGAVLDEAIAAFGAMPLPPYIGSRRPADERDLTDYQTVYARREGAVAAPTAGLHFTPELFNELKMRGIEQAFVTLHVGPGTFQPVKVEDTRNHRMQPETGQITAQTAEQLNHARARGGRLIAVGTTSLRLLESAADETGLVGAFSGSTTNFITPGYRFRAADALITNFHLPRSTLFMLVAAFSGLETMRKAYAHAIATGYRFYSYGDASLLFPAGP